MYHILQLIVDVNIRSSVWENFFGMREFISGFTDIFELPAVLIFFPHFSIRWLFSVKLLRQLICSRSCNCCWRRKAMLSVQHSSRACSPSTWTPWNTSCFSRSWLVCVRQRTSCWWSCRATSLSQASFLSAKVPWVSETSCRRTCFLCTVLITRHFISCTITTDSSIHPLSVAMNRISCTTHFKFYV